MTLSIVGTRDLHGMAFARDGLGGLLLLAGHVNNLRAVRAADGGAVVLVDAGDTFQGGIESNLSRTTLVGTRVSGAATLDVHVVQPLGRSWELIGGSRNIFDNEYLDPVSGQHRQDAIPQNGRTARIGLRWKLWTQ